MNDIVISDSGGYAHQLNGKRVAYDDAYYHKVCSYDAVIEQAVNDGRCAMLMRHLKDGASVVDIGAGSGAFVRAARSYGFDAYGYDVMNSSNERLKKDGMHAEASRGYAYDAIALWDVLEHMDRPAGLLSGLMTGTHLFASVPMIDNLHRLEESKHYRPGEHLHYWTESGFILFVEKYGYKLLEYSDHEIKAGRESIGAFAFIKENAA